jgi:serine protease
MVEGHRRSSVLKSIVRSLYFIVLIFGLIACIDEQATDPEVTGTDNEEVVANSIISGSLTNASGSAFDGDVNDPNAAYVSNDTLEIAQDIPNPTKLGGYVNIAGSGPAGRSFEQGDRDDYYRVQLFANQSVSLYVPASTSATSDNQVGMFLLDSSGELVQHTTGEQQTEFLNINNDGVYYIRVMAFAGAANYVLTIGLSGQQQTQQSTADIEQPFVPGEIIVEYRRESGQDPGGVSVQSAATVARSLGLRHKAGTINRPMLFAIDNANGPDQAFQALGIKRVAITSSRTDHQLKRDTIEVVRALRQRPDIVSARLNYIRQPSAVPNDEYYSYQWHYPQINLPQAWDVTTGNNSIVAVIDTGVLLDHPDLQGQLVVGYDFIRSADNAGDGDGIDDDPYDVGDNPDGNSSFHGTHVSGTIAAASDNLNGVAGVAWDAKIMPLRALGRFGGTDYDIEQAVRYAAGLPNDSNTVPAQVADVINLSLGGPANSTIAPQAYRLAREAGVIVVAAAGNEASSGINYPASLDGVVSVSATTINNTLASYSNFGPTVDIAAPGGSSTDVNGDGYSDGVLSTVGGTVDGNLRFGFVFYQGTSMAAPHVAGVVALMKAVNPNLTPQQFDNLLASGELTTDLGSVGRDDQFGYGLVNAARAVSAASDGNDTPPEPLPAVGEVQPAALNFGADTGILNVEISNGGDGDLSVLRIENNATGWLTVSPASVDNNGLGRYVVQVDRSILPQQTQTYSATITVTTDANIVNIPVLMQVYVANFIENRGYQYVVLKDNETLSVIDKVEAQLIGETYHYRFDNVPAGTFQVIAGTDMDNDGQVCETAEACGAYLMPTVIRTVVVDGNSAATGIDFETSFDNVINASMNPSPVRLPNQMLY